MTYKEKLEQIDQLLLRIGEVGKLDQNVLKRINYKFRLDWNYYSNRMEGGTLTRQETRSLMVGHITIEGKPIRDVLEMRGHDNVVLDILNIGKGEIRISEKRIKDVHKAIFNTGNTESPHEPIGTWKEVPNEIINYKNEKIAFTPPHEVQEEIHDLLNKTNADLDLYFKSKSTSRHPLLIAADFHIGFLSIHPFFDGNGRMARIFTNLILISCGYPPVIITDRNKQSYYQILGDIQAYGGDKAVLYDFMADLLLKSVELVNNAISGKDIEDDDDLDKRLNLLENRLISDKESIVEITADQVDISKFYETNILPLFKALEASFNKLTPLFAANEISFIQHNNKEIKTDALGGLISILQEIFHPVQKRLLDLNVNFIHRKFKKAGLQAFDVEWRIFLEFEDGMFCISTSSENAGKIEKLYHQNLDDNNIKTITEDYLRSSLDRIEQQLEAIDKNKKQS